MAITKGSGANFIDLTGKKFGKWIVVNRTAQLKKVTWNCLCECGTERIVNSADLKSGKSKSCGCLIKEKAGNTVIALNKNEYNSWTGMKQRCYYKKHIEYNRYGGRGIVMCDEWKSSFYNFLRDMGKKPDSVFSIERINQDGNYEPSNCKWANKAEQSRNTSRNIYVEYDNGLFTLKELSNNLNLNYSRLHAYFRRRGLPLEQAIQKAQSAGINRPYRYKPL